MRKIDQFLYREVKIAALRLPMVDMLFALGICLFSLAARLLLFPKISGDFVGFLDPWMDQIRRLGGIPSLGHDISNYSSAYMIIMSLLSYLPVDALYSLKAVSVIFDYIAAFAIMALIYGLTASPRRALVGMAAFLMLPTVLLNGAYWAQCDIIYGAFIILAITYYSYGDAPGAPKSRLTASARAFLLLGVALAFKLQTLLILPFFIILWLCPYRAGDGGRREIMAWHFLLLPMPYVLFTIPGIILGRSAISSLGVYFSQAEQYPWLTLNYPNIYAFFGQTFLSDYQIPELAYAGFLMTVCTLGLLAYVFYVKKVRMDAQMMMTLALFSLCLSLYGLPYMHERYGILVDVLAVVYAVLRPKKIPIAMGLIASSLMSYALFLFGVELLSPIYHALLQLVLVVALGMDLHRQLFTRPKSRIIIDDWRI